MTLGANAGAPKKFSFSFGKKASGGASKEGAAAGGSRGVNFSSAKTAAPPRAVFEEADASTSALPKAQALLSISGGELQVEGGPEPPPAKVIPCKNPLSKSNYRVRVIEGKAAPSPQPNDGGLLVKSEAQSQPTENGFSKSDAASPATGAVVYGLQEFDRGGREKKAETPPAAPPTVKTEAVEKDRDATQEDSRSDERKIFPSAPRQAPRGLAPLTDEEVAAALIAEAQGRSPQDSGVRAVPLLARNASLAAIRQRHREEQLRRKLEEEEAGKRRREASAGEPDRELLRKELELLPEALPPSSLAYEAMPVEEFGLAMLRGMGFTDSLSDADAEVVKRTRRPYARAGLGSEREMDRLAQELKRRKQAEREEEEAKAVQTIPLQCRRRP